MARKNAKESAPEPAAPEVVAESAPEAAAPATGTDRVIKEGAVIIPGPTLPKWDKTSAAVQAEPKEAAPAPKETKDVRVTSEHLVKSIARTSEQNRMTRLKELARTNRDVAWLLESAKPAAPAIA